MGWTKELGGMDRRLLAGTDLQLSSLGFGAAPLGDEYGALDAAAAIKLVRQALDLGVNYFDTSPYYGRGLSERRLGEALIGVRERTVISTKAGRYDREYPAGFDFSRARIEASINESLRRLRTDYIDIVFLHDIEFGSRDQIFGEALPALAEARDRGKVRFIGVSGYPLPVLGDAASSAEIDAVLSYCHADLLDQGLVEELMPIAERHGCGVVAASPFHMGLLSPQGSPEWHPAGADRRAAAAAIAARCMELNVSLSAAAITFATQLPGPASVLSGVRSSDELVANLSAVERPIDCAILASLAEIAREYGGDRWQSGIR
jgi:L-galactose dehydrogenase